MNSRNHVHTKSEPSYTPTGGPPGPHTPQSNIRVPQWINLQVGPLVFTVFVDALTAHSAWFAARLCPDQALLPTGPSGAYLVPADPALFPHILNYIVTGAFPLFWHAEHGFDHQMYALLLGQAAFLGMPALKAWILEKRYLGGVKHKYTSRSLSLAEIEGRKALLGADRPTLQVTPYWHFRKIYLCPRRVAAHRGAKHLCDAECAKKQASVGGAGARNDEYEQEPMLSVQTMDWVVDVDFSVFLEDRAVN